MSQLSAIVDQMLERGRRCPQRPVAQPHLSQSSALHPRMLNADDPAARLSRRTPFSVYTATPRRATGRSAIRRLRRASSAQSIQGVALADRSEIDLQSRSQKTNRAPLFSRLNPAHPHARRRMALHIRRHAPRPSVETPRLDRHPRRDVERSLRLRRDLGRLTQQIEQSFLTAIGSSNALRLSRLSLAMLPVHRQLIFQRIEQLESDLAAFQRAVCRTAARSRRTWPSHQARRSKATSVR